MLYSNYFIYIAIVLFILCVLVVLIAKKRRSTVASSQGEQLYIGNLPYHVNNYQLKEIFSRYGEIQDVRVIKNARTGRSKGFAFITYVDSKNAKKALSAHGESIQGRSIVVRMAKPR